jgi:16S rRNA (guanine527-N7)-methyltransferase
VDTNEKSSFEEGLASLGIAATEQQITALLSYCNLLEETNRSFNLTRIPRPDYVPLHLLDSLTCLPLIGNRAVQRIIDVGTGAGFPAVPLAALLPEIPVVALDATLKKVRWVEQSAHAVGITNIKGIHARAEALARTAEHGERYDVVVSRAVAPLVKLTELVLPLVAPGGTVLAMKGQGFEAELELARTGLEKLGGTLHRVHEIVLPGTDIHRFILVIEKTTRSAR